MPTPTTLVIYHKSCPSGDGFGAAFAAWLALGDRASYLACDHSDDPPNVEGLEVFILDLSFPPEALECMGR